MKPYSEDLRWRVVGRVGSGDTVREVATMFDVSVASVVRVIAAEPVDDPREGRPPTRS